MSNTALRLLVNNCRAIRKADIVLDGISVLAGVNASGKSTISHLFHSLICLSELLPDAAKIYLWRPFARIARALMQLKNNVDETKDNAEFRRDRWRDRSMECEVHFHEWTFEQILDSFQKESQSILSHVGNLGKSSRILSAQDVFLRSIQPDEIDMVDLGTFPSWLDNRIKQARDRYGQLLKNRDYEPVCSVYPEWDQWVADAELVSFFEGDNLLFKSSNHDRETPFDSRQLKTVFGAKSVYYIESPWNSIPRKHENGSLQIAGDPFLHPASDGNTSNLDDSLFDFLSGVVKWEESKQRDSLFLFDKQSEWWFKRKDGAQFPLNDCATGVRAISTLNILYSHGCLNSETVLIIDEPEAHLHPQWIVRYAEILTLISKRLGVRILLATHSPYMIRALRNAGIRNLGENKLRFYLAQQSEEDEYRFNYEPFGIQIGPIFQVFNVALNEIATYGES
jgi:hypothetical protein